MGNTDPFEADGRRLVAAFTRRLADENHPDPGRLANELLVMARGHGWRPVEALQPPPRSTGTPGLPADYLERKAALDGRPPCVCGAPVGDHQLDAGRRIGCARTGCRRYAPIPVPTPERSS